MTGLLEADSIQLSFSGRVILSSVYIKLNGGKITTLIGRNGSGKSSLMKIIYGTLPCANKLVRINEIPRQGLYKRPNLLRYLPQEHFIPPEFTLKRVFGDYALEFGEFTGFFPEYEKRYTERIKNLSGGLRRLLEVYLIIRSNSLFVMLDEPFSRIMPIHIEKIQKLLLLEKANKGILITDHLYTQLLDISDRFYFLNEGHIIKVKDPVEMQRYGYYKYPG